MKKQFCIKGHLRSKDNLEGNSTCVLCRRARVRERRKPEDRLARSAYDSAKARCSYNTGRSWKYYGGRGIKFKFVDFKQFLSVLGPHPGKGYSLDRIDSEGHYEVGNVRWATNKEQGKNRNFLRHCTDEAILAEVKRRGLLAAYMPMLQEDVAETKTRLPSDL
jgi:hypothetical protein